MKLLLLSRTYQPFCTEGADDFCSLQHQGAAKLKVKKEKEKEGYEHIYLD